jgi:hypothetical protein
LNHYEKYLFGRIKGKTAGAGIDIFLLHYPMATGGPDHDAFYRLYTFDGHLLS